MSILLKIMILLPIIQTWMIWNGFPQMNYVEHILYILLWVVLIYNIIKKNTLSIDRNLKVYSILFSLFLFVGFIFTALQTNIHGEFSIMGITWESYKLIRNIAILLISYWFQEKNDFIKISRLYINVAIFMTIVAILQYFFGIKFYELIRFFPTYNDYPDFYDVYIPQNRSMGLMQHSNIFGQFVAVSFLILLYFNVNKIRLYKTISFQYLLLFISFTGVLVSSSRSTFLLCICIPLLVSIIFRIGKIMKIFLGISIFALPFIIFAINQLIFKLWQYSYYTFELGSTEVRLVYWGQAIDILFSNLLIGSGLGTWGDASARYANYQPFGNKVDMSDSYLSHLIVEHGLGLFFLVLLIFMMLIYTYRLGRKTTNKFLGSLNLIVFSLIIFIIFASINTMQLSMFENTFIIFYMLGFLLMSNAKEIKKEHQT